jgi:hypothetical protein
VDKESSYSLNRRKGGERPTHDSPSPVLGQQAVSLSNQLIHVDVVKGHEQKNHQRDAEYEEAGSGVTDEWTHDKRGDDRDEQRGVPMRREPTVDFFSQVSEPDYFI